MQCAKLASLASFGTEKPPPDPKSKIYAEEKIPCVFCGWSMRANETGSCPDCGLGIRHWKPNNSEGEEPQ